MLSQLAETSEAHGLRCVVSVRAAAEPPSHKSVARSSFLRSSVVRRPRTIPRTTSTSVPPPRQPRPTFTSPRPKNTLLIPPPDHFPRPIPLSPACTGAPTSSFSNNIPTLLLTLSTDSPTLLPSAFSSRRIRTVAAPAPMKTA